jgi:hypothetical protein
MFGWLLHASSDRGQDALRGSAPFGLAMLGIIAAGAMASNRRRVLTFG